MSYRSSPERSYLVRIKQLGKAFEEVYSPRQGGVLQRIKRLFFRNARRGLKNQLHQVEGSPGVAHRQVNNTF